jgi:hypothetical protein
MLSFGALFQVGILLRAKFVGPRDNTSTGSGPMKYNATGVRQSRQCLDSRPTIGVFISATFLLSSRLCLPDTRWQGILFYPYGPFDLFRTLV